MNGVKESFQKYRWLLVCLVLFMVSLAALIAGVALLGRGAQVTASRMGEGGIDINASFSIQLREEVDEDTLRQGIQVYPPIAFNLTQEDGVLFQLAPAKPLEPGQAVTILLWGKPFIFEVENRLLVIGTLPANGAIDVPVDTGIEFTFSLDDVAKDAFETAFTIVPAVEGRFATGNGRYIFYPIGEWEPDTEYVITLDGALASAGGALLRESHTLSFTTGGGYTVPESPSTGDSKTFSFGGNGISVNALSSETPMFEAFIGEGYLPGNNADGKLMDVKVYALPGMEDYTSRMEAVRQNKRAVATDYSGLELAAQMRIEPISLAEEGRSGKWLLPFPEPLAEGWYAVSFTLNETVTKHQLLQVSDLSVFYMWTEKELLAWVNDAANGQPVNGATVRLGGGVTATGATNNQGVATLSATAWPDEENMGLIGNIITVQAGNRAFVDLHSTYYYDNTYYAEEKSAQYDYISYLYCDRPIYHSTDTMNVWGIVRPRDSATAAPSTVQLVLGEDLVSTSVELLPDGTFTGRLSFENLNNSWRPLYLKSGDRVLQTEYLEIADFVKPTYTAETQPEQPVFLLGPQRDAYLTLDVTTFDGTPAAGFATELSNAWGDHLEILEPNQRTDRNGHVRSAIRLPDSDSWFPSSYTYQYSSGETGVDDFYLHGNVYYIARDVMLEGKPEQDGDQYSVQVSTHRIDIAGIEDTAQLWDRDNLRGEPLSQAVSAEIHDVTYDRIPTGTRYDYILRRRVDTYKYERKDTLLDTVSLTTKNGAALLENLPPYEEDHSYYVVLRTQDSHGRVVETTVYLGREYVYNGYWDDGNRRYELQKQLTGYTSEDEYSNSGYGYWYHTPYSTFGDGEKTTFRLLLNEEKVEEMPGQILYSVVQDGFTATSVSSGPSVTVPFREQLLPNYVVTGAYFDGKHIFKLEDTYMYFDADTRELDIELTPGSDQYGPGDNVTVSATVRNAKTGAAAPNTRVLLSVVDEAVFAVREQYTNLLGDLYQPVYYPSIRKYTSYFHNDYSFGGEKGGGGGNEPLRKDFEDTTYFATATTDASGKASFSWKLPDNITEWRLTSLALTRGNWAGTTTAGLISTQDFFMNPVANTLLLTEDSCVVAVRGSGRSIQPEDLASYTAEVTGNGVTRKKEAEGPAQNYLYMDLGQLPAGNYTLTLRGASRGFTDGIQLPIEVIPSGVEVSRVQTIQLQDGVDVEPIRYPVNMVFYGEGAKTYNQVLQAVYQSSYGARADMRLGRKLAATLLDEQGGHWFRKADLELDISDIANSGNRLRLYPYADPDLELTVKARLALPSWITADRLGWLDEQEIKQPIGYLALALAGEPVEGDLSQLLEANGSLSYTDKMYLAMAMAQLGDKAGATRVYNELVLPNIRTVSELDGEEQRQIVVANATGVSSFKATATALMLATMLETEEADSFARYLAQAESSTDVYLLEMMYYLTQTQPRQSQASFRYTRNGSPVTETLPTGMASVSFTKAQLEEANFDVLGGTVYADVYYTGAAGTGEDTQKQVFGLERTITPVDGTYEVGSLVKVTLTSSVKSGLPSAIDMTSGNLVMDEFIPTGLRFVRVETNYDTFYSSYLNGRLGQRMQFTLYKTGPVSYYAQVVMPGQYTVDSAYISAGQSAYWGASERSSIQLG